MDASPQLRSKKALIELFIAGINDVSDVLLEWRSFVLQQKENDLSVIISEEHLKPEETKKFMDNAFRDGVLKRTGTDIEKIIPPVSRFGGGDRDEKKQRIIEKLAVYFEKYYGLV